MEKKPKAIIISDVHYSLQTLPIANDALKSAISLANTYRVPLIVAGDLHDTKANIRGECVKALLDTFELANSTPIVLIGNHDRINERAFPHSLEFLRGCTYIVDDKEYQDFLGVYLIAYQPNLQELKDYLRTIPKGSTVIMHQGISGSDSGEYIQDPTALSPEDVSGLNVISGHYHRSQTIALPEEGSWTYIGNPYTLNYGEADHPQKGCLVLHSDNSIQQMPNNFRRHRVFEFQAGAIVPIVVGPEDLVWIKISGTKAQLAKINKEKIAKKLELDCPFRLTLISTDKPIRLENTHKMKADEIYDKLIDSSLASDDVKAERLKMLWRNLFGDPQ